MKISAFAVLPASVRYDRTLLDKSILLWGEIAASADPYGICTDDNNHFATTMNVDVRTINRLLNQLIDAGHLVRVVEGNKRKLRVIIKGITPPDDTTVLINEPQNVTEFANKLFATWENALDIAITDKESLHPKIRKCLTTFTEEEILEALRRKLVFLAEVRELGSEITPDIRDLLSTDELVRWLKANHI